MFVQVSYIHLLEPKRQREQERMEGECFSKMDHIHLPKSRKRNGWKMNVSPREIHSSSRTQEAEREHEGKEGECFSGMDHIHLPKPTTRNGWKMSISPRELHPSSRIQEAERKSNKGWKVNVFPKWITFIILNSGNEMGGR